MIQLTTENNSAAVKEMFKSKIYITLSDGSEIEQSLGRKQYYTTSLNVNKEEEKEVMMPRGLVLNTIAELQHTKGEIDNFVSNLNMHESHKYSQIISATN